VIRWDQEDGEAWLWTAYAPDARRWARRGMRVQEVKDRAGAVTGWSARCPRSAIRYRRLGDDGEIVRRAGPAREGAVPPRKWAVAAPIA
jgi:hypothetical protein